MRGFQEVNTGPVGVGSIKGALRAPGPSDQQQRGKKGTQTSTRRHVAEYKHIGSREEGKDDAEGTGGLGCHPCRGSPPETQPWTRGYVRT